MFLVALCWFASIPFLHAQQNSSCCIKPAPEAFATFASNQDFRDMHANPLPFTLQDPAGKMVTFPVAKGKDGQAYFVKAGQPSENYLIVIHEWWGLNDYIKQEADRLAKSMPNVNILAVDLYEGKVAETKEQAAEYVKEVSTDRATAVLKGAIASAGKKAEIQSIGWCFGGSWSLQTALLAGKSSIGCVMFYGMPEMDVKKLKNLKCDVLGIFAKKDQHITPKVVAEFQKNMKEAGQVLTVKNFEADHAFANPSSPAYDSKLAQAANRLALDYLKKRFNANE